MANLGLIDFKLDEQTKFEVHISKNLAKMAINWHKNRPDATFGQAH